LSRASYSYNKNEENQAKTTKENWERDEIVYVYKKKKKSPGACGSSLVVDKHVCEWDSNNKKCWKETKNLNEKNFKLKLSQIEAIVVDWKWAVMWIMLCRLELCCYKLIQYGVFGVNFFCCLKLRKIFFLCRRQNFHVFCSFLWFFRMGFGKFNVNP
jgi:hypothetical protein